MPISRQQHLILGTGALALFVLLSSGLEFTPLDAKPATAAPPTQRAMQLVALIPLAAPVGVQTFMDKMASAHR